MMIQNGWRLMGASLVGCLLMTFGASVGRAELLSPSAFADCDLHIVGIYMPTDHNTDDRVFVHLTSKDKPVVLVLSAYFETQWNLELDEGVEIRQIIVPGYFEQSVVGAPEGTPIETITYFHSPDQTRRDDFFFAYALETQRGRELQSRVLEMTGLKWATFQGGQELKRVTIDGKAGRRDALAASQDSSGESTPNPTPAGRRPSELLPSKSQPPKLRASELREPEPHASEIEELENEALRLAQQTAVDPKDAAALRERLGPLVRRSFDLQTQLYEARLAAARENLTRVELQLLQRRQNTNKLIAARVEELISQGQASLVEDPDLAAALATEGWELWRQRDYAAAGEKFEQALARQSDDPVALNGLGWSQFHLGKRNAAIATFQKLLKDSPEHGGALNGVGQSLLAMGKPNEAKQAFLTAIEIQVQAIGEDAAARMGMAAWYGLVRAMIELKEFESAADWAQRYVDQNDESGMKDLLNQARRQLD